MEKQSNQITSPDLNGIGNESTDHGDETYVMCDPSGRYQRTTNLLGRGAYKEVYKAYDNDQGMEVAWNQLLVDHINDNDINQILSEITLLASLRNENIINLFRAWSDLNGPPTSRDGRTRIFFITELMSSGTLKAYMKKNGAAGIKPKVMKHWSKQILKGLNYLHSHNPPIIHRDLKCDNIFINGNNGVAKIGDLGMATLKEKEHMSYVVGTPEFMAPELYDERYDEKVDIYAFGMCLLEMATREYPYSECTNSAQIFRKVTMGIKPQSLSKVQEKDVLAVIEKCISMDPRQRPTAKELLESEFLAGSEVLSSVNSDIFMPPSVNGSASSLGSANSSNNLNNQSHNNNPVFTLDSGGNTPEGGGSSIISQSATGIQVAEALALPPSRYNRPGSSPERKSTTSEASQGIQFGSPLSNSSQAQTYYPNESSLNTSTTSNFHHRRNSSASGSSTSLHRSSSLPAKNLLSSQQQKSPLVTANNPSRSPSDTSPSPMLNSANPQSSSTVADMPHRTGSVPPAIGQVNNFFNAMQRGESSTPENLLNGEQNIINSFNTIPFCDIEIIPEADTLTSKQVTIKMTYYEKQGSDSSFQHSGKNSHVIKFPYNLELDTPLLVALEMVREKILPEGEISLAEENIRSAVTMAASVLFPRPKSIPPLMTPNHLPLATFPTSVVSSEEHKEKIPAEEHPLSVIHSANEDHSDGASNLLQSSSANESPSSQNFQLPHKDNNPIILHFFRDAGEKKVSASKVNEQGVEEPQNSQAGKDFKGFGAFPQQVADARVNKVKASQRHQHRRSKSSFTLAPVLPDNYRGILSTQSSYTNEEPASKVILQSKNEHVPPSKPLVSSKTVMEIPHTTTTITPIATSGKKKKSSPSPLGRSTSLKNQPTTSTFVSMVKKSNSAIQLREQAGEGFSSGEEGIKNNPSSDEERMRTRSRSVRSTRRKSSRTSSGGGETKGRVSEPPAIKRTSSMSTTGKSVSSTHNNPKQNAYGKPRRSSSTGSQQLKMQPSAAVFTVNGSNPNSGSEKYLEDSSEGDADASDNNNDTHPLNNQSDDDETTAFFLKQRKSRQQMRRKSRASSSKRRAENEDPVIVTTVDNEQAENPEMKSTSIKSFQSKQNDNTSEDEDENVENGDPIRKQQKEMIEKIKKKLDQLETLPLDKEGQKRAMHLLVRMNNELKNIINLDLKPT